MDYRQRLYASYHSTHWADFSEGPSQEPEFEAHYSEFLPKDAKAAILEIGCGNGNFLSFLRNRGYLNAVGIDHSEEQVAAAKSKGFRVESADGIEYLRRHPKTFDFVIAQNLIEHIRKEDVLSFFDAIREGLKPGGRAAFSTVNGGGITAGRILYGDFTHETAYTATSFRQIFRAAQLRPVNVLPMYPVTIWKGFRGTIRRTLWKLTEQALRIYMHGLTGSGLLHADHIFTDGLIAIAEKPLESK